MSDHERLVAAVADRYRIERRVGEGGMAAVYLARDLKHDRPVALKVLKPELAAVLGAERFVQEIRTTAALQHPHILPLFDSGSADGFLFYAMPYIEGETLRARLDRETQLGIDDAVRIACEIADALAYAHRHGVIHRDIKPENILLHDGHVSVADFGIALAVSAAAGGRMTETGLSLGTPHYMSPEQATADKELTGRSDIYSLGAVLYEMLAGDPPHTASSAQQVIMRIIAEPVRPVTELRKSVPANVAFATVKALQKLPADRFDTAESFLRALRDPAFSDPTVHTVGSSTRGSPAAWRGAAIAFGTLSIALGVLWWRSALRARDFARVARYAESALIAPQVIAPTGTRIAMSPDGSRLVYVGADSLHRLWIRETASLTATPLVGTEGAANPFFSPDGKRVAFRSRTSAQFSVTKVDGGDAAPLSAAPVGISGATWSPDGWIYSAATTEAQSVQRDLGLVRVREGSDKWEQVTTLRRDAGETDHKWPQALPDGRHVVFVVTRAYCADNEIAVTEVGNRTHRVLTNGVMALYASSGHLLVVTASGALQAAEFDPGSMRISGDWTTVATGLRVGANPHCPVDVTLSRDGLLRYVAGMALTQGTTQSLTPVFVKRDGVFTAVDVDWNVDTHANGGVSLSPDGRFIAVTAYLERRTAGNASDIAIKPVAGGTLTRLTFDGAYNRRPAWSPDGRSVTFIRGKPGTEEVWEREADGSQPARLVRGGIPSIMEALWSPRREWLVYRTNDDLRDGKRGDVLAARRGLSAAPLPLAATEFEETSPSLSPDGAWLAYSATAAGSDLKQVYVRSFANPSAGPWQVSEGGGTEPMWAHSGREIFYRNGAGAMVVATVMTAPAFQVIRRNVLFDASAYLANSDHAWYDVSPDDKSFLMMRGRTGESLVFVDNLFAELRAKVKKQD